METAIPTPHGRFQRWLDLVLANANVAEKAREATGQPASTVDESFETEEEPKS